MSAYVRLERTGR